MSLPSLPVETWHQILQECISVPKFLDPNHLSEVTDPLYDMLCYPGDGTYWAMENCREILQKVCKSWGTYLAQLSHRYIRLVDIYHGKVPREAIYKAIRIDCGLCDDLACHYCFTNGVRLKLSSLVPPTANLLVEIITGPLYDEAGVVVEILTEMYGSMPRLSIILNAVLTNIDGSRNLGAKLNSFHNLQFLFLFANCRDLAWPHLCAGNLTTISYHNELQPFALPLDQWESPALQHLRFPFWSSDAGQHIDGLLPVLAAVGYNLRSLLLGKIGVSSVTLPEKIWALCPQLERLDSCLCLHYPPPRNHLLHTISAFFPESSLYGPTIVPFSMPLLNRPSLRRVILQVEWKRLEKAEPLEEEPPDVRQWFHECVSTCEDRGIILEDSSGVLFKNSGLIKNPLVSSDKGKRNIHAQSIQFT